VTPPVIIRARLSLSRRIAQGGNECQQLLTATTCAKIPARPLRIREKADLMCVVGTFFPARKMRRAVMRVWASDVGVMGLASRMQLLGAAPACAWKPRRRAYGIMEYEY